MFVAEMAEESQCAYQSGFDVAKNEIPVTHPIRLGLVLNLSVFHYEILNEPDVACRLAKQVYSILCISFFCSPKYLFHRPSTMLWPSWIPSMNNLSEVRRKIIDR